MKHLMLLAGVAILAWGAHRADLPQIVTDNDQKLQAAKSFTATYTVQVIGEAANPYELSYSKPNLFKVTGPDGWWLADGKTIYAYTAKDNSWTETPIDDDSLAAFAQKPEVWGWSSFFVKDALKQVAGAKVGAVKNVKGNPSTEVEEDFKEPSKSPVTMYVDQKLGIVRSYRVKVGPDKELLVMASDIKLSEDYIDGSQFVFTAPAGAKKVEPVKEGTATYAAVQQLTNDNCMPCHNAQNRRSGIDLTNYKGILAVVTPGDPAQSLIVKSLRGNGAKQMPQGRSPLSADKIKLVEDWISAGAKQ